MRGYWTPHAANFATGTFIMLVGDAAVQLTVEQKASLDGLRLGVCSAFNGLVNVPIASLMLSLDRIWPGRKMLPMLSKVAANQIITSTTLPPSFLAWTISIENILHGNGLSTARAETVDALRRDGPRMCSQSMLVWTPANVVAFASVPQHLRVAFLSCVSVCWTGYLSFVAHRVKEKGGYTTGITRSN